MASEDDIARALMAAEDAGPPEDRPVSPQDRVCAFLMRNDIGNAERLLVRYGDDLVFHPALGWGVWNGQHWNFETGGLAAQIKAQLTARAIFVEVRALPPPDPEKVMEEARETHQDFSGLMKQRTKEYQLMREAGLRFAKSSGNSGKVSAMLTEAAPHKLRQPAEFDANPFALNVINKTLHLKPGGVEARPHHRGDLITKMGGCAFDPKATCPEFEAFLARMQPDAGMRAYLQRVAGYLLTGSASEQVVFVFYGRGSNGKGTLMNAWRSVLGGYAVGAKIETFGEGPAKDGASASPDVARIRGARFVAASDAPERFTLSDGVVKQATGEEAMVARELHKGFIEFEFMAKVIFPCNNKPKITGKDDGIWRRIQMVPWPVQMGDEEKAEFRRTRGDLRELLKAEAPGILNWMLKGYLAWAREGLNPPETVRAATVEYRQESDQLGEFLSVWTDADKTGRASSAALFAKYKEFCTANAYPEPKSGVSFGKQLKEKGYANLKSGVKVWLGLRLRDEARADEGPVARPQPGAASGDGWDAAYRLAGEMRSPDPVERAGDDREGGGFDRPNDRPFDGGAGNPFEDPFAEYDD